MKEFTVIYQAISETFGSDPLKKSRDRKTTDARFALFSILRGCGMTFQTIGELTGFHHATVMNGVSQSDNLREYDAKYTGMYNSAKLALDAHVKEISIEYETKRIIEVYEQELKIHRAAVRKYNELIKYTNMQKNKLLKSLA